MDMDVVNIFLIFLLGFSVGTLVFLGFGVGSGTDELGQAICEQEYNQDFVSYDVNFDNVLKCKPKDSPEKQEHYDGIIVEIKK